MVPKWTSKYIAHRDDIGSLRSDQQGDTTVSSSIDCFFWEIFPAGEGIYPSAGGKYLDFCLCTISTVSLYGKQGEFTAVQ
jgi:hypothetical protein